MIVKLKTGGFLSIPGQKNERPEIRLGRDKEVEQQKTKTSCRSLGEAFRMTRWEPEGGGGEGREVWEV